MSIQKQIPPANIEITDCNIEVKPSFVVQIISKGEFFNGKELKRAKKIKTPMVVLYARLAAKSTEPHNFLINDTIRTNEGEHFAVDTIIDSHNFRCTSFGSPNPSATIKYKTIAYCIGSMSTEMP